MSNLNRLSINVVSVVVLLTVYACGRNMNFDEAFVPSLAEAGPEAPPVPTEEQEVVNVERKLIKEGNVSFETDNMAGTRQQILISITKYKGYASSDQAYNSYGQVGNTIVVRVPADQFDNFLQDATKGVRKFDSKQINVKDVTEEFLDVEARLNTKKELEKRYLELLQKTVSIKEILEVEKQIGLLRTEIESIEGRLRYLKSKVSLSTLTITFYKKVEESADDNNRFTKGFKNGWDNLIWFFVFLTNIWPFILLAIGLIYGIKYWAKKREK